MSTPVELQHSRSPQAHYGGGTDPPSSPIAQDLPEVGKLVFRVRGIPQNATLDDLEASFTREFKHSDGTGNTIDKDLSSLVPSCYRLESDTQAALIQFRPQTPLRLEVLEVGKSYNFKDPDLHCQITIDKDFMGMTQLYATTGPPEADIIAISGLNGHAYGSWTGESRTMIFGYYSELREPYVHDISDYTQDLLQELMDVRRTDEEAKRPIIFMGHSFGGIIITHSIVEAIQQPPSTWKSIIENVKGIIFFGTPHRGLEHLNELIRIVDIRDQYRLALLKGLESGSPDLEKGLSEFKSYCEESKMEVLSIMESRQTRVVTQDDLGRLSRNGELVKFVTTASSELRLSDGLEIKVMVEGDHSNLVKLENKHNKAYSSVIDYLHRFINRSEGVMSGSGKRPRKDSSSSSHGGMRAQKLPRKDYTPEASFNLLNHGVEKMQLEGEEQCCRQKPIVLQLSIGERRDLLAWLSRIEPQDDFDRLKQQRHPRTGTWLTNSAQFKEWMNEVKHCLLWCWGTAGVGKSVLLWPRWDL